MTRASINGRWCVFRLLIVAAETLMHRRAFPAQEPLGIARASVSPPRFAAAILCQIMNASGQRLSDPIRGR